MNSHALATLSAHPVLATAFGTVLVVGIVCILREIFRTVRDAAAARTARRLRRERVGAGASHDATFLARR